MDWLVGMKVVCVFTGFLGLSSAPELDQCSVYTVKRIWPKIHGHVGLELVETRAAEAFKAFDERRFVPAGDFVAACLEAGVRQKNGPPQHAPKRA